MYVCAWLIRYGIQLNKIEYHRSVAVPCGALAMADAAIGTRQPPTTPRYWARYWRINSGPRSNLPSPTSLVAWPTRHPSRASSMATRSSCSYRRTRPPTRSRCRCSRACVSSSIAPWYPFHHGPSGSHSVLALRSRSEWSDGPCSLCTVRTGELVTSSCNNHDIVIEYSTITMTCVCVDILANDDSSIVV